MYDNYQSLTLKRHDGGILEIIMGAAQSANKKLSTADHNMHRELSTIWLDIDRDPQTRVAVIRGEGKGFSAGGDLGLVEDMARDFEVRSRVWREARAMARLADPHVVTIHEVGIHGAAFRSQILHLPGDDPLATRSARQFEGQLVGRVGRRGDAFCQPLKGQGEQGVSGQDGVGFPENLVTGRTSPAQVIIVHGGQVVVNQGVGVQQLNGRAWHQGDLGRATRGFGGGHAEDGA